MSTIDYDYQMLVDRLRLGKIPEPNIAYEFSDGSTFERDPEGIESDEDD